MKSRVVHMGGGNRPAAQGPGDLADFVARRLPSIGGGPATAAGEALLQHSLYGPLLEFLARPSKGLRAQLVCHVWRLCGGHGEQPATLAMLPELLHGASLIVDDIQDDADSRRGGPALHRVIGVGPALNVANWLYFWPQALVDELPLSAARRRRCTQLITNTLLDCHRGQALDLGVAVWDLPPGQVPVLVHEQSRLKTGRLTALCTGLGAVAAGARPAQVDAMLAFGERVGIALQMLDDLTALLVPARQAKAGEDLRSGRSTWAWALAAQGCTGERYRALARYARVAVRRGRWQAAARVLRGVIEAPGCRPAQQALAAAAEQVRGQFPAGPALAALLHDLASLERAYG
jgi:geranylgeranyl pyrophosphate synthase